MKEEEANQPHGCSASKLREDDLRDQRFNLEKQKRAGKDGERVQTCDALVHSGWLNADAVCFLPGIAFHFNLLFVCILRYQLVAEAIR